MLYVTAKRLLKTIHKRFDQFGFPLKIDENIIPPLTDESTLFICSGMQQYKSRFQNPDNTHLGTIQSCIRTNDLDLVGDGGHLTYFQMIGNFSFGNDDYQKSIEMWLSILSDLDIRDFSIHYHPDGPHKNLWPESNMVSDPECLWTDGNVGGYCCEVFIDQLEIGNLVNPLGHSTDVGFGLERILQIIEKKKRVDETSLFDQTLHPVTRDHVRCLNILRQNNVRPGYQKRESICRKLVQNVILFQSDWQQRNFAFDDWLREENEKHLKRIKTAKRSWRKYKNRDEKFWKDTFGVTKSEVEKYI